MWLTTLCWAPAIQEKGERVTGARSADGHHPCRMKHSGKGPGDGGEGGCSPLM